MAGASVRSAGGGRGGPRRSAPGGCYRRPADRRAAARCCWPCARRRGRPGPWRRCRRQIGLAGRHVDVRRSQGRRSRRVGPRRRSGSRSAAGTGAGSKAAGDSPARAGAAVAGIRRAATLSLSAERMLSWGWRLPFLRIGADLRAIFLMPPHARVPVDVDDGRPRARPPRPDGRACGHHAARPLLGRAGGHRRHVRLVVLYMTSSPSCLKLSRPSASATVTYGLGRAGPCGRLLRTAAAASPHPVAARALAVPDAAGLPAAARTQSASWR
ncbi:hypothetical protein CDEN61S_02121 [Castellaniella denitrificans]